MQVRPRCLACRQPAAVCWCSHLPRLEHGADVVLLQHPREARNPLGTARMAHLALPGSTLAIGVDFARDPQVAARLEAERARSIVLYPAPDARPIDALPRDAGPLTLWVIDGTWWQAKKVWQSNPALHGLPAYRLAPAEPSAYGAIRREPTAECLSTVEAIASALDVIHDAPGRHAGMLAPMRALVARQLAHAQGPNRTPRHRIRPPGPRLPPRLPPALRDVAPERVLLIHAEGNGWPGHPRPRPPAELVQWLALRPATGERFGMLVDPGRAIGAAMRANLELDDATLAAAATPAELAARWRAFVREDDVWCAWGHVAGTLATTAGLAPPPIVDLRALARDRLHLRAGKIEDALSVCPHVAAAVDVGRGGRRLSILRALYAALVGKSVDAPVAPSEIRAGG